MFLTDSLLMFHLLQSLPLPTLQGKTAALEFRLVSDSHLPASVPCVCWGHKQGPPHLAHPMFCAIWIAEWSVRGQPWPWHSRAGVKLVPVTTKEPSPNGELVLRGIIWQGEGGVHPRHHGSKNKIPSWWKQLISKSSRAPNTSTFVRAPGWYLACWWVTSGWMPQNLETVTTVLVH